jgi:hypothetical protein
MHLVARDGKPRGRHRHHAPDALLVAARQLSQSAVRCAAPDRMPSRSTIGYACTAAALAVVAAIAYDAIPDLPLAPQSDEPKKADFVLAGRQDFLQPLLLVQTVRLANLIARYTDQLALVELGRTVAAMFGGLTVLATIVLARRRPPRCGNAIGRVPRATPQGGHLCCAVAAVRPRGARSAA